MVVVTRPSSHLQLMAMWTPGDVCATGRYLTSAEKCATVAVSYERRKEVDRCLEFVLLVKIFFPTTADNNIRKRHKKMYVARISIDRKLISQTTP